jgi:uncharacterized spore protein YtfJ
MQGRLGTLDVAGAPRYFTGESAVVDARMVYARVMDFQAIAKHIAETIEHSGSAKAVFGEPVKLATQTIVPVAAISSHVGGGGGRTGLGGGGGGGFHLRVVPIGYIHEKDGAVVFSAIDVPEHVLSPPPKAEEQARGAVVSRLIERIGRG